MKNKLIILLLVLVCLIPIVYAPGPYTHFDIISNALKDAPDGYIKQTIMDNMDGCYAGLEYPDVGIFYYYSDYKEYTGLHSYNVVDNLLSLAGDNKKFQAFAYCYKIHLASDGISHNYYVPLAIRQYHIENWVIHPIQELKIEGQYTEEGKNIVPKMMERHSEYDKLMQDATGKDWSKDADSLNGIMGGDNFYSEAYTPNTQTFMGTFQVYAYKFVGIFVQKATGQDMVKMAIDASIRTIGGGTEPLDPAGTQALKDADKSAYFLQYLFSAVIMIFLIWLLWRIRLIGW
jgi:hypothetical protein